MRWKRHCGSANGTAARWSPVPPARLACSRFFGRHWRAAPTGRCTSKATRSLPRMRFSRARALAGAMAEEKFDLVLTGLQSDDQGHAQTGVVLAERLGIPHSTIIMEVQVEDGRLRVKRELEGGWFQWIAMPLPALLTIQSGINQLRYATLKGIMAAKKKEIRQVPPPAGLQASQRIVALAMPSRTKETQIIGGSPAEAAKELVRRLREEARAL